MQIANASGIAIIGTAFFAIESAAWAQRALFATL